MLGFLGFFGRAPELRRLDAALRNVDLHPRLVPEAVKLAALRQMQQAAGAKSPPPETYDAAAALLAYCMLGPAHFAEAGELDLLNEVERRVDAATADDGLDARLVLLALHAGVVQPEVVSRFGLEAVER